MQRTITNEGREPRASAALPAQRIAGSLRYDAVAALLAGWFVGGMYLDGWAHIHVPSLETFFTPWHGVLYSGFFASALFLAGTLLYNLRRGYSLRSAMPLGYGLSLIGAGVFLFGGVGDLVWHELFGIEANVEALLSPTHLLLALGGVLIGTGPLRAAMWRRREAAGRGEGAGAKAAQSDGAARVMPWPEILPALMALVYLLSVFTFFTEYASPFAHTLAAGQVRPGGGTAVYQITGLAVASILLQAAFATGVLLFGLRRWRLPFGSAALVLGLNAALMGFMHNGLQATGPLPLIAAAVLAGLAGDAVRLSMPPARDIAWAFRVYAFAQPALLYALYFAAVLLFGRGTWWSIHLVAGSIVLAGIVGWLLSYAFLAPDADSLM